MRRRGWTRSTRSITTRSVASAYEWVDAVYRDRTGANPAEHRKSPRSAGLGGVGDVHCRPAGVEDLAFLATMLGEAAVWRPDKPTPTGDAVMADPRYVMYLAGWPRQGDYGLVAEQDGPVGAAWYRTYTESNHGYGFVAEDVPELSIAVIASRRHEGIGRRLLVGLIDASLAQGYSAISLSVREANPARGLYESAGFVPVKKNGTSWTMRRGAKYD
jgi:GNAT superfamily N-acetyltransferase